MEYLNRTDLNEHTWHGPMLIDTASLLHDSYCGTDKFEKGIYAVQVQGRLPEDIEEDLESKNIKYRPR